MADHPWMALDIPYKPTTSYIFPVGDEKKLIYLPVIVMLNIHTYISSSIIIIIIVILLNLPNESLNIHSFSLLILHRLQVPVWLWSRKPRVYVLVSRTERRAGGSESEVWNQLHHRAAGLYWSPRTIYPSRGKIYTYNSYIWRLKSGLFRVI